MTQAIKPVNRLPERRMFNAYPDDVVQRAEELVISTTSIASAWRALKDEMGEGCPSYEVVCLWARQSEECLQSLAAESKREMVSIASDAVRAWGGRMLSAADTLPDSQVAVPYGIAMQRRTDWESAGNKGNQMNVQFNFVRRSQADEA